MRTRAVHLVDESTSSALSQRKCGKTFRALAGELGLEERAIGTLSDVIRRRPGAVTIVSENDLRRRLGLPVISTVEVPPCPTCGDVHIAGDCGGRPVVAVVTLAPGEVVTRGNGHAASKPRKTYYRPCLPLDKTERRVKLLELLEECHDG